MIRSRPPAVALGRESVGSALHAVRSNRVGTGSDVVGTTESPKGTMVLQVLDQVSASNESFYGDCPVQTTYTNLDLNATGHTTCTVVPQGTLLEPLTFSTLGIFFFGSYSTSFVA